MEKPIIFVIGGPGSGKGTQCGKIVEEFRLTHLSAGDLLRKEVESGSERGKEIDEIMKSGALVKPKLIIQLLSTAIKSAARSPDCIGFLVDGFPRELNQVELFETEVWECRGMLLFDCSEDVMTRRLLERAKTSGRVDDNKESISKRLATYKNSTLPVIEHFNKLGKSHRINADRPVDAVYCDVRRILQNMFGI